MHFCLFQEAVFTERCYGLDEKRGGLKVCCASLSSTSSNDQFMAFGTVYCTLHCFFFFFLTILRLKWK